MTRTPPEPEHTSYSVAPWWPEGYGGGTSHKTEEDAIAEAESLASRGFGEIHVWRTTSQMITRIKTESPIGGRPGSLREISGDS